MPLRLAFPLLFPSPPPDVKGSLERPTRDHQGQWYTPHPPTTRGSPFLCRAQALTRPCLESLGSASPLYLPQGVVGGWSLESPAPSPCLSLLPSICPDTGSGQFHPVPAQLKMAPDLPEFCGHWTGEAFASPFAKATALGSNPIASSFWECVLSGLSGSLLLLSESPGHLLLPAGGRTVQR